MYIKLLFGFLIAFILGFIVGTYSEQSANRLLKAGFIILDEDGYEVESFDSFYGYWTKEPKPH